MGGFKCFAIFKAAVDFIEMPSFVEKEGLSLF